MVEAGYTEEAIAEVLGQMTAEGRDATPAAPPATGEGAEQARHVGKISNPWWQLLLFAPFLLLIFLLQQGVYGAMLLGRRLQGKRVLARDADERIRLKDRALAIVCAPLALFGRLIARLRR